MDLTMRINSGFKTMSKGQKLIAEYILAHYDKAAFMTAAKLASRIGVSESTVVRFADALGYDGYPKLQRALQEMIRTKLTTVQRIEMTGDQDEASILQSVFKTDMANIRSTLEEIDPEVFSQVVESIFSAKHIYILGLRSAAPLVQFFSYYLSFIFENITVVTSGVSDEFEQIFRAGEGDLLIGVSFPRYSSRTVEGINFAKKNGVKIVSITDSLLSPLASQADLCLVARSDMASFADSMVAAFSLVNALIVAIGSRKKDEISQYFTKLEAVWDEYSVYLGKDRNAN